MEQNTKDWLLYSNALVMLISAIAIAVWSFSELSEVLAIVVKNIG